MAGVLFLTDSKSTYLLKRKSISERICRSKGGNYYSYLHKITEHPQYHLGQIDLIKQTLSKTKFPFRYRLSDALEVSKHDPFRKGYLATFFCRLILSFGGINNSKLFYLKGPRPFITL